MNIKGNLVAAVLMTIVTTLLPTNRQLGFFGEPGVHVLELNLALDVLAPVKK